MSYNVGDILRFNSPKEDSYWEITKVDNGHVRAKMILVAKIDYTTQIGHEMNFPVHNIHVSRVNLTQKELNQLKAQYL